ncbi:flagellar biosynthesis anti-sigma factor FlgM [Paraburkholderia bonniea]|uniref:flagellar biosynthesis anti-sigma factor FlgM n=1 Tax=Paraburkholderia bonniea TaxID=2152891 RepID=UPI001FE6A695|nr:flagellar biosynthesis anti-sigma factor FlgM [Paraburkholderia bonniea]WJF90785.1 flagellar biosynthesis anti-sigma factor FlgM [Paraburkholderia bonniea]WJF94099.1 flagellar biosynthesis anti-sigma factor FlgM [Paraburkholderia bonniea]
MRITNLTDHVMINETAVSPEGETAIKISRTARVARPQGASRDAALLKTVQSSLGQAPQIDAARVAEIKNALDAGEITFDAGKLAALMLRYHGGRE